MKQHRIDKKYMLLAIKEAEINLKTLDGGPFGAAVVRAGKVISVSRNTVLKEDASAHAEINAIRSASRKLKSFDLSGCVIYSTTEPCPMCFSAIHWARINTVIYGTDIRDAKKIGFHELPISNERLKKMGNLKIRICKGLLKRQCQRLFLEWDKLEGKRLY